MLAFPKYLWASVWIVWGRITWGSVTLDNLSSRSQDGFESSSASVGVCALWGQTQQSQDVRRLYWLSCWSIVLLKKTRDCWMQRCSPVSPALRRLRPGWVKDMCHHTSTKSGFYKSDCCSVSALNIKLNHWKLNQRCEHKYIIHNKSTNINCHLN